MLKLINCQNLVLTGQEAVRTWFWWVRMCAESVKKCWVRTLLYVRSRRWEKFWWFWTSGCSRDLQPSNKLSSLQSQTVLQSWIRTGPTQSWITVGVWLRTICLLVKYLRSHWRIFMKLCNSFYNKFCCKTQPCCLCETAEGQVWTGGQGGGTINAWKMKLAYDSPLS